MLLAWEPAGPTAPFSLLGSEFAAAPSSFHRHGPCTMLYAHGVRQMRPRLHPFSLTTPGELRKTMNGKEIDLSFHPSTHLCIYPSIHLHLPTHPSVYLPIHPPLYPPTYLYTSVHLSIHISIHLSIYPSILQSFHPPTHPPISHREKGEAKKEGSGDRWIRKALLGGFLRVWSVRFRKRD